MKSILLLSILYAVVFSAPDSLSNKIDSMVIKGNRPEPSKVNIKKAENLVGKSDDLNNLVFLQPSVARVPEAGSLMLVQGDSYYDNSYYLFNIPVFTLSHFSGQVFTDRSIISLTSSNDVHLETQGLPGKFSGASGSVLSVNPTLQTGKGALGMAFPILTLNYGTIGADLTLKVPFHKIKNYYEITVRPSNRTDILCKDVTQYDPSANVGFSQASSYDNIQIHGIQKTARFDIEEYIIYARDNYTPDAKPVTTATTSFPWDIGIVSIKDNKSLPEWNLNVGGSQQYSFEGKKLGSYSPLVKIYNQNAAFCLELKPHRLKSEKDRLSFKINSEFALWNGNLLLRGDNIDYLSDDLHNRTKGTIAAQTAYLKSLSKNLSLGIDANTGIFLAGTKGFIDPGLSLRYSLDKLYISAVAGIVSSQPDIRGLPSDGYANKMIHTYRGDFVASLKATSWLSLSLDAYVKLKDHVPLKYIYALSPIWDETSNAHGRAYGATLSLDATILKNIRVWSSVFISKSTVYGRYGIQPSDWEIPWTIKNVISYSFIKDIFTFYITSYFSEGMPYRNLVNNNGVLTWDAELQRAPPYKSIDLKLEFCQPIDKFEWHVMEFAGYIFFPNASDEFNVREYYWDNALNKYPIHTSYASVYLGLRATLRF